MEGIPNYAIIRMLDEYSQLDRFKGSKELFFVRHAGGIQHSDPTVQKGWGLYFWDAGTPEIPGSWRKIAEQEGIDITPDQFVSKEEFQAISDRVSTLNAKLNDVK